jgi:hypothetical protein
MYGIVINVITSEQQHWWAGRLQCRWNSVPMHGFRVQGLNPKWQTWASHPVLRAKQHQLHPVGFSDERRMQDSPLLESWLCLGISAAGS